MAEELKNLGSDIDPETGDFVVRGDLGLEEPEKGKVIKESDRVLNEVGLKIEDLSGKRILDLGSSSRELEIRAKMEETNGEVISLDNNLKRISKYSERDRRAVVGDADQLPFINGQFDLVIAANGPLSSTNSPDGIKRLKEVFRVLGQEGEVRITKPFWRERGIGEYCYQRFSNDPSVKEAIDSLEAEYMEGHHDKELERDSSGCITPSTPLGDFLWYFWASTELPPETRGEVYQEMEETLRSQIETDVDISYINPYPEKPIYWPTMILRKK